MVRRRSLAEDDAFQAEESFPPEPSTGQFELVARLLGFAAAALPMAWLGLFYAFVVSVRVDAGAWPHRHPTMRWAPWGGSETLLSGCELLDPLVLSRAGAVIFVLAFSTVVAGTGIDLESRRWRTAATNPLLWLVASWLLAIVVRLVDPGGLLLLILGQD